LGDLAAIRVSPPADGELTQDLLYRPPIERKLSDEQSSNRLDSRYYKPFLVDDVRQRLIKEVDRIRVRKEQKANR